MHGFTPIPVCPAHPRTVTGLFTPTRQVHGGSRQARACPGHSWGPLLLHTLFLSRSRKSPTWLHLFILLALWPEVPEGPSPRSEDQSQVLAPQCGQRGRWGGSCSGRSWQSPAPPRCQVPRTWCPGQWFAHPPTRLAFLESLFCPPGQLPPTERKAETFLHSSSSPDA